jgi:hypothetical protein
MQNLLFAALFIVSASIGAYLAGTAVAKSKCERAVAVSANQTNISTNQIIKDITNETYNTDTVSIRERLRANFTIKD